MTALSNLIVLLFCYLRFPAASSSSASSTSRGGAATTSFRRQRHQSPWSLHGLPSQNNSSSSRSSEEDVLQREDVMAVTHPDGSIEMITLASLISRLEPLALNLTVSLEQVANKTFQGMVQSMSSQDLASLIAETSASLATQHYDYSLLAAGVLIQQNYITTPSTFSEAMQLLEDTLAPDLFRFIQKHADNLNQWILPENDQRITYLGFSTLHRSYLLRKQGAVVERPQYLYLRVALGIHYPLNWTDLSESDVLNQARETYILLSTGVISHASPTLFHAGTRHSQLSSCFLVQMTDDSIHGIYETLSTCAVVSKGAGGVGLAVSKIRARGTRIAGTGGVSNGLVPMLRVYDATCRYVDQGGGKRPGAFAIYLEPWHADIYEFLNLKKNHGKEEQRARDLFYGLWIPDLFMQRVFDDDVWSLMCPHQSPGLHECHSKDFVNLYETYEREGRFVRQVRARELWAAILDSQIETGTPYMLYKDACNVKSNHQHLGCISSSNLCTEIIQYTSPEEVAVCNLASLCLSSFVRSSQPFGSPTSTEEHVSFDHAALHCAVKIVTRNLNKIIDINQYPVPESRRSNVLHRPIGIGVSGLADTFVRLGLPFASSPAKQLNKEIFETIYHAALEASAELAERDGPYPSFSGSHTSYGQLQFHLWGMDNDETPSRREFAKSTYDAVARNLSAYAADVIANNGYDWDGLCNRIQRTGLRNSLLVAPMPTASTAQILGVNECFEPFSSNLYIRRVKAGEFIYANPHLLRDLIRLGLWTPSIRNQLMRDGGSVQNIAEIPQSIKDLYRTVWEISMKDIIDMAVDRGRFIDQSQSLNLFMADPTLDKLTAMHFYAWRQGLKTGMYYLRTKPAVNAIQYTVEKEGSSQQPVLSIEDEPCTSCSV